MNGLSRSFGIFIFHDDDNRRLRFSFSKDTLSMCSYALPFVCRTRIEQTSTTLLILHSRKDDNHLWYAFIYFWINRYNNICIPYNHSSLSAYKEFAITSFYICTFAKAVLKKVSEINEWGGYWLKLCTKRMKKFRILSEEGWRTLFKRNR